ncbi:hypothetical protein [Citricoccus sp. GCM10030269]|uniref:hypothetical protein n=1 Tax=Citricoccus sp. GCM10030269 TaxID=3273388 RepID=UPI0036172E7D
MTVRRRPDRSSGRPDARRAAAGVGAALAAVVLAGCTIFPSPDESTDQDGNPLPTVDAEGFAELPLYFVALNGEYPPNTTGREVACQDLLVRTTTVPVKTEDPVASAIGFLLSDEQYSHGDPAVTNSLDPSEDDLRYVSHRVEGDTVVVELTGDVVSRSQCESFRIRAQLHQTAATAAGVPNAEILVDGVRLEDLLAIPDLELGEEITTPPRQPEPTEGAAEGSQGVTEGSEGSQGSVTEPAGSSADTSQPLSP